MIIENEILLTVPEALKHFESVVANTKWKVIAVHDLQLALKNAGKDVLPVLVVELCNPAFSGVVLDNDQSRFLSAMMPCRLSLYEKGNGKTYVSRINPEALHVPKALNGDVMRKASDELELLIRSIIKKE